MEALATGAETELGGSLSFSSLSLMVIGVIGAVATAMVAPIAKFNVDLTRVQSWADLVASNPALQTAL